MKRLRYIQVGDSTVIVIHQGVSEGCVFTNGEIRAHAFDNDCEDLRQFLKVAANVSEAMLPIIQTKNDELDRESLV